MLINRLLHRWVLMNAAGDADGGGATAGTAAGTGADSATASAGAGGDSAGSTAVGSAASTESASADAAAARAGALQPPGSLVAEAGQEQQEKDAADTEKPAEDKGDQPKAQDKPIDYEAFKLPDGFEVADDVMKSFKDASAAAKLSQEQAQSFMDMHTKALQDASAKPYQAWHDMQKQWQDEIKADPDFGGAKLETETIPSIARAIKAFSPTPEAEKALRQAFHFTGAGNNPEMIRFMARLGQSLAEGTHVSGKPAVGDGGKSAAEKMYPTHTRTRES